MLVEGTILHIFASLEQTQQPHTDVGFFPIHRLRNQFRH